MEITSKMLQGAFSISLKEVTKYGRRLIDGYWHDQQSVGTEKVFDLTIGFQKDCDRGIFCAALMASPPKAYLQHITNLMAHKNAGTNEMQLSFKLKDYVEAMKDYPEWVVWQVCRNFIFNYPGDFAPSIPQMKDACGLVQGALERRREGLLVVEGPVKPKRAYEPPTRREKPKTEWTETEWVEWVDNALGMVTVAKNSNGLLDPAGWEKTYADRKAELERREEAKAARADDVAEDVSPFA